MGTAQGRTTLAVLSLLVLAGCAMPRALPAIRESGDRAYHRGQYELARSEYSEYLARRPGEPRVHLQMARTLIRLGRAPEAVEHAQIALDAQPGDDEAIETLAEALFHSGRVAEMDRFLRGVAQSRGAIGDYLRLGRFLAAAGDPDAAEYAFKRAAEIDGGRTVGPQLALADFYASIGDRSSQLRRLRMALYVDPHNPDIARRIRELGEIPGPSLAIQPEEADGM